MEKSKDAFRTISEVAEWLDVPTHVLRFWESRFTQIKPVKRAGGRRYYRPSDMELLGGIKRLLHDDGLTIRGVQKLLREKGVKHVSALSPPLNGEEEAPEADITIEATEPHAEGEAQILPFARADTPKQLQQEAPERPDGHENTGGSVTGAVAEVPPEQAPSSSKADVPAADPLDEDERGSDNDVPDRLRRKSREELAKRARALRPIRDRLAALLDRMTTPERRG